LYNGRGFGSLGLFYHFRVFVSSLKVGFFCGGRAINRLQVTKGREKRKMKKGGLTKTSKKGFFGGE
jgi:hypothetical protein